MKKLIVFLLLFLSLFLFLMPFAVFAQIWEGNGGNGIDEELNTGNGSGGGWIPEPLDPNMTHYVISFKDDNQTTSLFSPIELNENTVVDLSIFAPTRSVGYDFSHWEDGNGDTVTSVTMTADTTVYAVWTVHTHSITWQITDNSKNPAQIYTSVTPNVAYGTIIVASDTPTVPSGYEFSGWEYPSTMPDYDLLVSASIDYVNIVYKIEETPISSTLSQNTRYPVIYDGTIINYTPITYTDGVVNMGSWESWINKHFTPVMLKSDGNVDYELSRENQNYRADGVTPSDIANINYDGNAMLRIKKFYISCSTETVGEPGSKHNVHTIRISDSKKDNTYTCWGFVDADGVEHDYAYYGLYMGHVDANSKLRSISGITLSNVTNTGNHLKTYSDIVAAAKANGNGWSISNFALENAIGLVMMMIYKDVNPMFVSKASLNPFTSENVDICKVTGTRSSVGGFPYTPTGEQQKALWIENYWTCYSNTMLTCTWCNGLGSVKGSSDALAYYRLTEPFDLSNINDWTFASNTEVYTYSSSGSHQTSTMVLYDNILFPKSKGWSRAGHVSSAVNIALGSGDIQANSLSYHVANAVLPGKTGAIPIVDQYCIPGHYCSYLFFGNRSNYIYGAGRLTYLSQPASLANRYNSIQTLSAPKSLEIEQNFEEKQLDVIATDSKEVTK
jgi:hypothetical protein